ncbi:aminodeoxychorismate/anthranilate synthase component II [Picrophilus oshimae]|nr:aminodeoxychorismate/anthranilate synthase component II [Picrophilus oshimae]
MRKVLIIDNYDSFTYNIYQYISMLGYKADVFKNDDIKNDDYDKIIISPGPGSPENPGDTGNLLYFIERHPEKKYLGICFGHQFLAYYLGSGLGISKRIMHGEIDEIKHYDSILYKNIPENFSVIRYHSIVVNKPKNIIVDAISNSTGEIMGFHNNDMSIFGVQFHPESYFSSYGIKILKNFMEA